MGSDHITGIICAATVIILVALLVIVGALTDSERLCAQAGGSWVKNNNDVTCTLHPVEGK